MEGCGPPANVSRLSKPEADAFRSIAKALGARYAGDDPAEEPPADEHETGGASAGTDGPRSAPVAILRGSSLGGASADPRAEGLLDAMPLPVVVTVEDAIAFVNGTALFALGYATASALQAAGGLGAVLDGPTRTRPGAMTVTTATGTQFAAKVTIAAISWSERTATLVVIERLGGGERDGTVPGGSERFGALLDADPDPVALLGPGGTVEACNDAFRGLGRSAGGAVRLEDKLDPDDLRHVMDLMAAASARESGAAQSGRTVSVAGEAFTVGVAGMAKGALHVIALRPLDTPWSDRAEAPEAGAGAAAPDGRPAEGDRKEPAGAVESPLAAAVRDVRALLGEAAILLLTDGDGPVRPAEAEREMIRLLLLSVAARAPIGSVLTVRCSGGDYAIDLSGSDERPWTAVLASPRIDALAEEAGFALRATGDGRLCAARTAQGEKRSGVAPLSGED